MSQDVSAPADTSLPQSILSIPDEFSGAVRLTRELFPGEVGIEVEDDPEMPGKTYVVFNVTAKGQVDDVINRRLEWRRQIHELMPGQADRLKLSVAVEP